MRVEIGPYPDGDEERKVEIHIDDYDVWGMDSTLALIVYPMLKLLKEKKHGAPFVEDSDVPEAIRSTSAKPKENEWDTDEFHFARWDWTMQELIWSFEQISAGQHDEKFYDHSCANNPEDDLMEQVSKIKVDEEGLERHWNRIHNGLRLFSKYYFSLWD